MDPSVQGDSPRWLYRHGSQIYGPVPEDRLIQDVVLGNIPCDIEVAKVGAEFFPIAKVSAFKECLVQAALHKTIRVESRYKAVGRLAILGALAFLAWSGLALQHAIVVEEDKHLGAVEDAKAQIATRIASIQALKPVRLTPFPTRPAAAKVKAEASNKGAGRSKAKNVRKRYPKSRDQMMVASCERSQKSIINGVKRHLSRINACIANEQNRSGKGSLGSTLVVAFVVRPVGSVVEFEIQDRVVAKTGLRNCLTRVFRGMRFPRVGGTNCPVTLPIKLKTD